MFLVNELAPISYRIILNIIVVWVKAFKKYKIRNFFCSLLLTKLTALDISLVTH